MPSTILDANGEEISKEPWWVKPVYKLGVPSVLAIFLIWFVTTQVRDKLESIDGKLDNHVNISNPLIRQNEQMLIILRQICINSATSSYERGQCLQ